ncbi:ER protein BIG1 [Xylariaceae sp. FL0662B]|nr:ER protein BIG1 [Xylariaceae sp. FL0662B]
MRFFSAAMLAACCASAQAFSDSSPFILFSTSKLSTPASQEQLQSSSQALSSAKQLLSSCPTDRYLIVSQPNLNAGYLSTKDAVPKLRQSLDRAKSRYSVAEVAGELDLKHISNYIREACEGKNPFIDEIDLAPISSTDSAKTLKQNDDELGMVFDQYDAEGSYTIIYAGGPRTETPKTYTAEFPGSVHTELKRQLNNNGRRADNARNPPLFEKYQYFTPGLFMGLVAFAILMSILYAGVSAVASLEVPYGAFDKEMGPAAQKKQQ